MDPTTTVALMTLNLAMTAALVAVVARHNPSQRPLLQCAVGSGLFSLAFLLRLSLALSTGGPWALVADVVMFFAGALFLRGQIQFLPLPVWPLGRVMTTMLALGGLHLVVTAMGGQQARHVLLNTTLATLYLSIAFTAWRGPHEPTPLERPAQWLMFGVALVLGAATALRGLDALLRGVETLFVGPTAQLYYAVSAICLLLMGPSLLWWMFARMNNELQRLATHDPLTGVLNRNGLVLAVRRHFGLRQVPPLVWLMLDLDHFKRVNDTLGHARGDQLLQAVAQALLQHVRAEDMVARLGGEEFLVGVVGPTPGLAEALAERLRAAVAALPFEGRDGQPWPCSVSIGVSPPFVLASEWESALRLADDALYAAKAAGRNRVVVGNTA
jgi:diguanylate cyclase (GGDEF)-like protein